jgi:hypothetical protein
MIPENQLLFTFARQTFTESHRDAVRDLCQREKIDWGTVYGTAQLHGVAPLVYENIKQFDAAELGIEEQVWDKFRLCYYANTITQEMRAKALADALTFFEERTIAVMLIKGVAFNHRVYERPWYTMADDVDLVLRLKREAVSDDTFHEFAHRLHGSGIEYDFYEHHDVTLNGVLALDFDRIWRNAQRIEFGESSVCLPTSEDMLLTACTNSCRKRFFRLKCLCDIAEMIARCDDLDWGRFVQAAKADDCETVVYTALLVTMLTVGCDVPEHVMRDLSVNPVRAKTLRILADRISRHASLSTLYPYIGEGHSDRRFTWSLILPYFSYNRRQLWRKVQGLYHGEKEA